jgi:hypothetical protein
MAHNNRSRRSWRASCLRVVAGLLALCGVKTAWAAPRAPEPIDRVTEIRERLLEHDERRAFGQTGDRGSDPDPTRVAQWINWPNYWRDWPNWGNWPNWRDWRNW